MSDNGKQVVTYIKNGQEVTKTLNWFNTKLVLRSLFKFKNGGYQTVSDIEFVHLKNCELLDFFALKGPENGEVIFDNCTFKRGQGVLGPDYMLISGNKVKLLNTKLDNFSSIMVNKGKEVEVKFSEEYKTKMGSLDVVDSGNVFVEDNNALNQLHVDNAEDVRLVGNFDVDRFSVSGDKVSIVGKSDKMIYISTKSSNLSIIGEKMLELRNFKVKSDNAYIKFSNLDLDNFVLDVKQFAPVYITDKRFNSGQIRNYKMDSAQTFNNNDEFFEFLDEPSNEMSSNSSKGQNSFSYKKDYESSNSSLEDVSYDEEQVEEVSKKR